jgi:hypothetical protein
VVDRSLREIRAVDLSKLVLVPGKKVWELWVDIYVLDHDGNLMDASMLAAMAALSTAKLPLARVEGEEVTIDRSVMAEPVPISHRVVTVTVGKIDKYLILDPSLEEESLLDARISFAVSDDGRIAGIQKMGMGPLTRDEVLAARNLALRKAEELHGILGEAVPSGKKAKAMEIIAHEALKTFDYEGLIDIDGIRIENSDWWILFRPSGTEPIMRITLEAHTEEKAKELMEKAKELVKKAISEA